MVWMTGTLGPGFSRQARSSL